MNIKTTKITQKNINEVSKLLIFLWSGAKMFKSLNDRNNSIFFNDELRKKLYLMYKRGIRHMNLYKRKYPLRYIKMSRIIRKKVGII